MATAGKARRRQTADSRAAIADIRNRVNRLREEIEQEIPPVDVKALRAKMGLSQSEFASRYGIGLRTLQDWELGRTQPPAAVRSYLRVIERFPRAVTTALKRADKTARDK